MNSSVTAQEADKIQLKSIVERPAICYDPSIILAPGIPLADKQRELAGLEAAAKSRDANALYLLGSLYRQGESHPAKVFSQDAAKAKIYLSNAAIHGSTPAMASMAEIEIKNKDYREAMLWSQVFTHYSEIEDRKIHPERWSRKNSIGSNQAYQAYLLQRIMQVTSKDKKLYSDAVFLDDLRQFHANYDQKIIDSRSEQAIKDAELKFAGCYEKVANSEDSMTKMVSNSDIFASASAIRQMPTPGYAFFYLSINPKGAVTSVLTVDSLPDGGYAKAMTSLAKKLRFNEIKGSNTRTGYLPMSFDDYSAAIKRPAEKKIIQRRIDRKSGLVTSRNASSLGRDCGNAFNNC